MNLVKTNHYFRGSKNEDSTVEHTPSQSIRETPVAMSLETPKEIFTLVCIFQITKFKGSVRDFQVVALNPKKFYIRCSRFLFTNICRKMTISVQLAEALDAFCVVTVVQNLFIFAVLTLH